MSFAKFFILLSCFLIALANTEKDYLQLPDDVDRCKAGDVKCIAKSATKVIKLRRNGSIDGTPPIDPFYIGNVEIRQPAGNALSLNISMRELWIDGLANTTITRVVGFEKNPATTKMELYGKTPKIRLHGKFSMRGRILLFPIFGEGDAEIIIHDMEISSKIKPKITEKYGKQFIRPDKIKTHLGLSKASMHFTNLFNGQHELGEAMNRLINENWNVLWDDLSPAIYSTIERVVRDTTAPMEKYAYEDIFLQE